MIAIDTNVLIRYLVQDHPAQSRAATKLLDDAERKGIDCLLSDIVLCEMVWVLESCYRHARRQIAAVLEKLLQTGIFSFESAELLEQVVRAYAEGRADFADYLICATTKADGCHKLYTFDRRLKGHKDVVCMGAR